MFLLQVFISRLWGNLFYYILIIQQGRRKQTKLKVYIYLDLMKFRNHVKKIDQPLTMMKIDQIVILYEVTLHNKI